MRKSSTVVFRPFTDPPRACARESDSDSEVEMSDVMSMSTIVGTVV